MTLIPGRNFTVVRQIANHLDSTSYYVQAVIRNAYTDEILATLDLTDKGAQRHTGDWRIPQDPLGLGFYVSIVTSVYTDSGHTTKSDNYGDEENTYLVAELNTNRTGGGYVGPDMADIRRIFQEEVAKIPPVVIPPFPEIPKPEMRWDDVLRSVEDARNDIKAIPPFDVSPILDGFRELSQKIDEKPVTPETNLEPVLSKLSEKEETDDTDHEELKSMLDDTVAQIKKYTEKVLEDVKEAMKTVKFEVRGELAPEGFIEKEEEDEEELPDISKLIS
jgi:hypothetical protein